MEEPVQHLQTLPCIQWGQPASHGQEDGGNRCFQDIEISPGIFISLSSAGDGQIPFLFDLRVPLFKDILYQTVIGLYKLCKTLSLLSGEQGLLLYLLHIPWLIDHMHLEIYIHGIQEFTEGQADVLPFPLILVHVIDVRELIYPVKHAHPLPCCIVLLNLKDPIRMHLCNVKQLLDAGRCLVDWLCEPFALDKILRFIETHSLAPLLSFFCCLRQALTYFRCSLFCFLKLLHFGTLPAFIPPVTG